MPKGLDGHTVSLTKNGYYKLINLIEKYPSDQILSHLDEIKIDDTQARKMLAGSAVDNIIPSVWDDVKKYDLEARSSLLLFSIIFSHKDLIKMFKDSTTAEMQGEIIRGRDTKTYTNLAYSLNEAGLAVDFSAGSDRTKYDLSKIFHNNEIGPLAKRILENHLKNMGWTVPDDSLPFQRTFEEQVKFYEFNKVLGVSIEQLMDWFNGINVIKIHTKLSIIDEDFLVSSFITATSEANLKYSPHLITRFAASLLTKPFLILTGLSGSGKTKLAQSFVQWMCQDTSQYKIVPVGADWTNREPLLGYPNALKPEEYVKPDNGVLDSILEAIANPELPFFLILDEMNLSHVERYFADFLSVMESKETIPLHAEGIVENGVPEDVSMPSNLFIIGTVNIDETTNMFSPKVLDRANTIEFRVNHEEMRDFLDTTKELDMDILTSKGAGMAKSFLKLSENNTFTKTDVTEINNTLIGFFKELKKIGAEFGYRTASEILKLINQLSTLDNELLIKDKIDIAIIQKLLPKLHGSRRKLCPVLVTLGTLCVGDGMKVEKDVFGNDSFDFKSSKVLYPLSLEKIARMHKGAIDNGFASFAEA